MQAASLQMHYEIKGDYFKYFLASHGASKGSNSAKSRGIQANCVESQKVRQKVEIFSFYYIIRLGEVRNECCCVLVRNAYTHSWIAELLPSIFLPITFNSIGTNDSISRLVYMYVRVHPTRSYCRVCKLLRSQDFLILYRISRVTCSSWPLLMSAVSVASAYSYVLRTVE